MFTANRTRLEERKKLKLHSTMSSSETLDDEELAWSVVKARDFDPT
jgi:hypothetical protein